MLKLQSQIRLTSIELFTIHCFNAALKKIMMYIFIISPCLIVTFGRVELGDN